MPMILVKRVLREAQSIGLEKVGLTGGEPFLSRQKLFSLGQYCTKSLKIPIHIHSNGTLITDYDANWVKEMRAEITIPLYSDTSSVHDSITGVAGSFESSLLGLNRLIDEKANVCVYIVPMKQNLRFIAPLILKIEQLGIKRVRVLSLSPTGRAKAQFEDLELDAEDTKVLNDALLKVQKRTNIELTTGFCTSHSFSGLNTIEGHEQCFAAENRVHIDTSGNVFPCTASSGRVVFSAGNLQMPENSMKAIWEAAPLLQFFRAFHDNPPKKCSICTQYPNCMSGCRVKMSYKFGDISIANPTCGGPYK